MPLVQGNGNTRAVLSTLLSSVFTGGIDLTTYREPNGARVFPYQLIYTNNNTIEACLNQCAAFGYPAAGAEFGDECCKLILCCMKDDSSVGIRVWRYHRCAEQ